ncbi:MAG: hypothetical protein JXB45_06485 [Candidatus Krumholzibacteriota bacterium]|nr:hypothetical protein [Candidatus Krumholzibacteriota bacterium]
MCVFTHFAAGALLGAFSPHVALAPVVGLGSHIVLDVIPHRDFENMKVEIGLGILALAVLLAGGVYSWAVILGGLAAVLPDLENLLWKLGKIRENQKIFPGHVGFIPHGKPAGKINLILQFILSAAALIFLIRIEV